MYYEETAQSVHPGTLRNVTVDTHTTEAYVTDMFKFTQYNIHLRAVSTRDGLPSQNIFLQTHEDSK